MIENKVILYDSNNAKIGETFTRRARQLVKQQRAEWTDETQSAIRFAPDVDDWEAAVAMADEVDDTVTANAAPATSDMWLVALAERRIKEREHFIIHSVVAFPLWLILVLVTGTMTRSMYLPFFFSGVCFTAYAIHAYQYLIARRKSQHPHDREERKARKLAAEIALLKVELGK